MTPVLIYLLLINLLTFVIRGVDKRKATKGGWRIRENHLLFLIVIGGGAGALLGQSAFRHKTIKTAFIWKMWLILMLWIVVMIRILIGNPSISHTTMPDILTKSERFIVAKNHLPASTHQYQQTRYLAKHM